MLAHYILQAHSDSNSQELQLYRKLFAAQAEACLALPEPSNINLQSSRNSLQSLYKLHFLAPNSGQIWANIYEDGKKNPKGISDLTSEE